MNRKLARKYALRSTASKGKRNFKKYERRTMNRLERRTNRVALKGEA